MPSNKQHSEINSVLSEWAKVALLVAAVGLVFGADAAFGFAKSFGQFIGALFLGGLLWYTIFGSIHWVFEKTDLKSGRDAAIVAMFIYVLIGLPLLVWLLKLLAGTFR